MDDFIKHREEFKEQIVKEMIDQFDHQNLTRDELAGLSRYIQANFNSLQNEDQLVSFINEIAAQFPFFSNLAKIEEGESFQSKEQVAAQEALRLLQSGQALQAAEVASAANHHS